jgi:hypothetical protein
MIAVLEVPTDFTCNTSLKVSLMTLVVDLTNHGDLIRIFVCEYMNESLLIYAKPFHCFLSPSASAVASQAICGRGFSYPLLGCVG